MGEEGEALVIAYERFRLKQAGKESLDEKMEWVSKKRGDATNSTFFLLKQVEIIPP